MESPEDFLENCALDLETPPPDPQQTEKQITRKEMKEKRIIEAKEKLKSARHEKQAARRTKKSAARAERLSKMSVEERKDFISSERNESCVLDVCIVSHLLHSQKCTKLC